MLRSSLAARGESRVARRSARSRCKESDGATAEAAFVAAEHGATSSTPQREGARSRSSDFHHGLPGWILLLAFASGSAVATAAQGNVLVVGPGGFSQIQDAVLAAQDGDTILVRTGVGNPVYNAIDVAGKALTIAADRSSGFARVQGLRVRNVQAGKTVVLSRLRVESLSGFSAPRILLQNNAGSARFVSCESRSVAAYGAHLPAALRIESCSGSTALAACTLVGGDATYRDIKYPPTAGGAGLEVEDATAAVYDSTITGGAGGLFYPIFFPFYQPARGGTGASVVRDALPSRLLLSNSSVQGGRGSELGFCYHVPSPSGAGGNGLAVGAGATAALHASTFVGGESGAFPPCGTAGTPGAPILNSGTLHSNPTSALELTTPTVAREGQTITLTIEGVPGDQVNLAAGLQTAFRELMDGVLLVRPGPSSLSPLRGHLGTIGPSGIFTVPYTLPQLPAGTGALNLWFQALARHTDGRRTLGSFSVVTVLDSAY